MALRRVAQTDASIDAEKQIDPSTGASAGSTFVGIVAALLVAASLSSGRLLDMASGMPFGDRRDNTVSAARMLDDGATMIGADRPADLVANALDRPQPGATESRSDRSELVVGELAISGVDATAATSTSTAPTTIVTTTALTTTEPAPDESVPVTTTPSSTTSEPPATIRQLRSVTADEPLRIWMGGDSLGEYLATQFLGGIADRNLTTITYDYNISTGLTRPDDFDWFQRVSDQMVSERPPEAMVWMVGGNDNQDMLTDAGRISYPSQAWADEYRARVGTLMDIAAYPDVQMIWIGLPPMEPAEWAELPTLTNPILAEEATSRPWVTYIDITQLFLDDNGQYNARIVGPDGKERLARAPDGVHITRGASGWIADLAWAEIVAVWDLPEG